MASGCGSPAPKGGSLGVEYESGRESVGLERTDQEIVLRTAPGDVTIDCGDPEQADIPPGASVRIEDPDGWYRSMEIGNVAGSCMSGDALYVEDARGSKENPVEQARKQLSRACVPATSCSAAGTRPTRVSSGSCGTAR